jgi:hypothetical protein
MVARKEIRYSKSEFTAISAARMTRRTNWGGTGVTPDVQVKSTEALQAAQRLAVDKIHAKSTSK